jgi:membrane-bound inhibitor of C-type lysozyme
MGFGRVFAIGIAGSAALASPAAADNIALYQCADGSQFALAFYEADTHAHLQLNGKALTLPKRLSLSGRRYSASGVTLRIDKDVTTLKHPGLPQTTCNRLDKW